MAERIPLVAVSHWRPGTGFTRVLESLFARLSDRFDAHWLGMGYTGPPVERVGYRLLPANPRGGDPYGSFTAAALATELGAPVALLLNDLWILANYPPAFRSLAPDTRTVAYVPIDGAIEDARWAAPLAGTDRLVAYTRFGAGELARHGLEAAVIPHGVDAGAFSPGPHGLEALLAPGGRAAALREALGIDDPDAWVVLNANRPNPRKRVDLTVAGFARFAAGKPAGVRLCLHLASGSAAERAALLAQAERLGVADRVILTGADGPLDDVGLATLYRACAVGINTAMGEGWGLVSLEHAAAGAAQVVPDHSACGELWAGAAELLPTEPAGPQPWSPLALRVPAVLDAADALESLYADRVHLARRSREAHALATRPELSWDAVARHWAALLMTEVELASAPTAA